MGAVEGDYSRSALAAEIISRTLHFSETLEERTFIEAYKKKSIVLGKTIRVYKGGLSTDPAKQRTGVPAKVLDIDNDGGLMVIYSDGTRETLSTGEISIRL